MSDEEGVDLKRVDASWRADVSRTPPSTGPTAAAGLSGRLVHDTLQIREHGSGDTGGARVQKGSQRKSKKKSARRRDNTFKMECNSREEHIHALHPTSGHLLNSAL